MEETTTPAPETPEVPTDETHSCPSCKLAAEEAERNNEMSMAFLLALTPIITLTFFGHVGLL